MSNKGQATNEMVNNKKVLMFKSGEEYKIKIEKPEEFSTSIFRDQYERAFNHVKTIISTQPEGSHAQDDATNDTYNNVIAFVGGRGSGKSSAMISFRNAFKSLKETPKDDFWKNSSDNSLEKSHFETIEIIDPSMFEEGDSILEIIVAQLFRRFEQKINHKDCQADYNKKRGLLECFQGVYDNLKTIQKKATERLDGEVIETLAKLASGSNLKSSIIKLVKTYLEFMSNGQDQSRFLLIAIDDFDLNTGHVYSMAEQIRKYLVIPGVIILMAVKIDQLFKIIESAWREEFELMIEEGRMESAEPQVMTTRYLEKLIPENRRLYLPQLRSNEHKDIKIHIPKEIRDNNEQYDDVPVEDAILKLIYSKTGLIFLKQEYNVHFLIPDNLRELHGLYVLLMDLADVDIPKMLKEETDKKEEKKKKKNTENQNEIDDKDDQLQILKPKYEIDKIRSNLKRFEDYFFYTWIKNKLSFQDQETIEMLMNVDIRQKNKHIIQELNKKITLEKETNKAESEEDIEYWLKDKDYPNIIQKSNNPLNISLGDVLYCLKILVSLNDTEDNQLFAFALKTAYSLILFKLIIVEDKYPNVQESLYDDEQQDNYQDVQVLLGGSVYNFNDTKLIRAFKSQERRDHFKINYKSIVDGLYNDKDKFVVPLEWLHYFLLFVGDKSPNYRKDKKQYYAKETNLKRRMAPIKYATFDVLAFVFFLFDPEILCKKSFENVPELYSSKKGPSSSLYHEISYWREYYRSAMPIFSIEFIEQIHSAFPKDLKEEAIGYYSYFSNFLKNIILFIRKILDKNSHLAGRAQWMLDAFTKCPIIKIAYPDIDGKSSFQENISGKPERIIPPDNIKWIFETLDNIIFSSKLIFLDQYIAKFKKLKSNPESKKFRSTIQKNIFKLLKEFKEIDMKGDEAFLKQIEEQEAAIKANLDPSKIGGIVDGLIKILENKKKDIKEEIEELEVEQEN